jgi:hypothetical protein
VTMRSRLSSSWRAAKAKGLTAASIQPMRACSKDSKVLMETASFSKRMRSRMTNPTAQNNRSFQIRFQGEPEKLRVDGYPREFWTDPSGLERIESYTITDMAHGTPLATNARDGACGATGPFLLQVGISSSYHIAKFFNIAGAPLTESAREAPTSVTIAPVVERDTRAAAPLVLEGEVLDPEPEPAPRFGTMPPPAFEIGAVINRALKAAGLIKD